MIDTLEQRSLATLSFAINWKLYTSRRHPQHRMMAIDECRAGHRSAEQGGARIYAHGRRARSVSFGIKSFIPIKTDLYRGMIENEDEDYTRRCTAARGNEPLREIQD
jgi:hypothetical protein